MLSKYVTGWLKPPPPGGGHPGGDDECCTRLVKLIEEEIRLLQQLVKEGHRGQETATLPVGSAAELGLAQRVLAREGR